MSARVRGLAAFALALLAACSGALAAENDVAERQARLAEIRAMKDPGPAELGRLVLLLQHADQSVRYQAGRALSKNASRATPLVPTLLRALESAPQPVRISVAEALADKAWEDPRIASALVRALRDPVREIRYHARNGVHRRTARPPEAVDGLLVGLRAADSTPEDRLDIVELLESFGEAARPATPALTELLADASPDLRLAAALALGELAPLDAAAQAALRDRLGDAEPDVALAATLALARTGDTSRDHAPILAAALEQPHRVPKARIARALGRLGVASPQVCSALLRLLSFPSQDQEVRDAEQAALRSLGRGCLPQIELAMSDPDDDLSQTARSAFFKLEEAP